MKFFEIAWRMFDSSRFFHTVMGILNINNVGNNRDAY